MHKNLILSRSALFGIRSALPSEMKVLRLQQSKSRTSEPRELAMLSTGRSLVSGSLFAIYLDL